MAKPLPKTEHPNCCCSRILSTFRNACFQKLLSKLCVGFPHHPKNCIKINHMQENLSHKNIHSYLSFLHLDHNYLYSYLSSAEILINNQVGYDKLSLIALLSLGDYFNHKKACFLQVNWPLEFVKITWLYNFRIKQTT